MLTWYRYKNLSDILEKLHILHLFSPVSPQIDEENILLTYLLEFESAAWACVNICMFILVSLLLDIEYQHYIHSLETVMHLNIGKNGMWFTT